MTAIFFGLTWILIVACSFLLLQIEEEQIEEEHHDSP